MNQSRQFRLVSHSNMILIVPAKGLFIIDPLRIEFELSESAKLVGWLVVLEEVGLETSGAARLTFKKLPLETPKERARRVKARVDRMVR